MTEVGCVPVGHMAAVTEQVQVHPGKWEQYLSPETYYCSYFGPLAVRLWITDREGHPVAPGRAQITSVEIGGTVVGLGIPWTHWRAPVGAGVGIAWGLFSSPMLAHPLRVRVDVDSPHGVQATLAVFGDALDVVPPTANRSPLGLMGDPWCLLRDKLWRHGLAHCMASHTGHPPGQGIFERMREQLQGPEADGIRDAAIGVDEACHRMLLALGYDGDDLSDPERRRWAMVGALELLGQFGQAHKVDSESTVVR